MLALFSPSNEELAEQQSQSHNQQKLEQIMVMAYLLANCEIISANDYQELYQALLHYLSASHGAHAADTAEQAAIRAKASYQLVYRYVPCDDASLQQTAQQLQQWKAQIFQKH